MVVVRRVPMRKTHAILAGIISGLIINFNFAQAVPAGLSAQLSAVEATAPTPAAAVPRTGQFYSARLANAGLILAPILPGGMNLPAWDLGDNVWLVNDLEPVTPLRNGMRMMADGGPLPPGAGGGSGATNTYMFNSVPLDTNRLWLELTNVSSGVGYANLHRATNQIYAIWGTTNLSIPFADWQVEAEVWPTNNATMPFTLATLNRQTLFLKAEDWTGVSTNGLLRWWSWLYFGDRYASVSAGDLDSTGTRTLGYDYTNGFDPNPILFTLQLPGEPVRTNLVNGTVTIFGGIPAYVAVLVNDTNDADALWLPYSGTNLTVSLNAGAGVYAVRVGLRGRPANAQPTWIGTELTWLPAVAPVLVITNPVAATVATPLIQLQGLVNENLSALTYDVSNAAGIFTNQAGGWQAATYDTNLLQFTTNAFQCYDLALTNGVNLITLHATDLAGNVTTTNFSYTLDYAGDTNSPALTLLWPQNGMFISGSHFTVQAQMDDPTANVTLTFNTNTVQGLVERGGAVWFNDLPLNSGTNYLTLTATDAAGNVSATNFCVIQSAVALTIDPLADGQLNQPQVTVTGTVADPSLRVWVNGVPATVYGNGSWGANNVPVSPAGTAGLNVQVTDAGGQPVGSQMANQPQPPVVSLMSYVSHFHSDATWYLDCEGRWVFDETVNWLYQPGGVHARSYAGKDGDCNPADYNYTDSLAGGYNGYAPAWEIKSTTENIYYPPPPAPFYPSYQLGSSSETVQARVMILPSGQQAIGQTALYLVQAQVTNENTGLRLLAGAVQFMNQLAGTATEDVTNTDGSVWSQALVSAPTGVNVEVTPIAAGNVSFTGMKLSPAKVIYYSVVPDNAPTTFNPSAVESALQSQLSANVFNNLQAGQSVQIKVHKDTRWPGSPGWTDQSKHIYVNRVYFGWGNVPYDKFAENDQKGGIDINLNPIVGISVTTQTWVNYFAHEGIWGNVAGKSDDNSQPTGEISSGTQTYYDLFTVSPSSRLTILNACGLNSN